MQGSLWHLLTLLSSAPHQFAEAEATAELCDIKQRITNASESLAHASRHLTIERTFKYQKDKY